MPHADLSSLVARSLDAPEILLPYLPVLLQDLEDLGARARDVRSLLEGIPLPRGCRVLDLGCGKGASAIEIARTFDAYVRGVDGLPSFVEHARRRAQQEGLAERCTFAVGDLREAIHQAGDYDVVMMLALGDVLGTLPETVQALLGCVRPHGYVVLDDAYLANEWDEPDFDPDDYPDCYDHATSRRLIEAAGARVVGEFGTDTDDMHAWLQDMTARVLARAEELAAERPDLAPVVLEYAVRQQEETQLLAGPVVGVTWLLERR